MRYIVPNVLPTIIVLATVQLGAAILLEATLRFLQFGIPQPVLSWGSIPGLFNRSALVDGRE